ncbi:MAG: hypothetical protein EOO36_21500 [Cytophagaceae bacterium]|nr:MAG: hypothetical protein EOO36_21500 [Cytophagaceae bacterium]
MTTADIVAKLNRLTISSSEDYAPLDRLDELTSLLAHNPDGQLACGALLAVLERHPHVEFGTPGRLVHAIESYRGHYEELLLASLNRRPTATTVWLLNRLLNAARGAEWNQLLDKLDRLRNHPLADEQAHAAAEDFYRFQTQGS